MGSRRTGKRRTAERGRRRDADIRVTALVASPLAAGAVRTLAARVLRAERSRLSALSITLVGPRRIRALNRSHLSHDHVTDVIAFALGDVGDVYICPAAARASARAFRTSPAAELRRLVVHGVLHVLGYDHPEGEARMGSPMWRRQERHLVTLARRAR